MEVDCTTCNSTKSLDLLWNESAGVSKQALAFRAFSVLGEEPAWEWLNPTEALSFTDNTSIPERAFNQRRGEHLRVLCWL